MGVESGKGSSSSCLAVVSLTIGSLVPTILKWHMRQQFCDALPPVAKEVVECVVSSADLQEGEGAEFGFVGSF